MKTIKFPDEHLKNITDAKLLFCYVLYSIGESVSKDVLITAMQQYGYINYFIASAAFSELLKDGSIDKDEKNENFYKTTEKGDLIAKELKRNLPLSIREKALCATINLQSKLKREKENKVVIEKTKNGFLVKGEISGGENITLMSFSTYVPDEIQAELIKKNFRDSPELFYECMLASLTQNKSIIKSMLEKLLKES